VRVTFEQRHHPGEPAEDLLLPRRLDDIYQGGIAFTADRVDEDVESLAEAAQHRTGVHLGLVEEAANLRRDVVTQPRHGSALRSGGFLVNAHPKPKVTWDDPQLTLDLQDVRCNQQESAVRGVPISSIHA